MDESLLSVAYSKRNSPLQKLEDPLFELNKVEVYVKRDDLLSLDAEFAFCGNKWRKLKYNLIEAKRQQAETLVSFGGAYSNHIAALASAGKIFNFKTIGIIRGEQIFPLNPTLSYAVAQGMVLWPVSRTTYREKGTKGFLSHLLPTQKTYYSIPEGGTNQLAIKGAMELADEITEQNNQNPPDYICACCGTGGTLSGMVIGAPPETTVIGFPVLKGDFMQSMIEKWLPEDNMANKWQLINDFHFGGYAKFQPELINFINDFSRKFHIRLDPIYTGKLFYGVFQLIKEGFFKEGSSIVILHSGGLQGIKGFNKRFGELIY